MKKNLPILLILVLASFLRLYQLDSLPISLFGDEIDVGYHAWSIWTTGRDYMDNLLPTYIQSLSEYRAPLLMYLTAPFVGILGPSIFSVRLPVALIGIASVYLLYLVSLKLFSSNKVALLSAFLLAVTPWHIHYSRASFEVVPLVFLILLGIYFYLNNKYHWSVFFLVLTLFTYSTAVIIAPLTLLGLLIFYPFKKHSLTKLSIIIYLLASALFLVSLKNIFFGNASARFQKLSILSSFPVTEQVILLRNENWVSNKLLDKLFINKYTTTLEVITRNYLTAFSPDFLFGRGDQYFRHSSGKSGEFLYVVFLLFIIGLFWTAQNISQKPIQLLLFSLLISPIPSALTLDGANHATRLFIMVLSVTLISSLSIHFLPDRGLIKKLIIAIFSLGIFLNLSAYLYNYYAHYKYQSWRYWHFGYNLIIPKLAEIAPNFDKVYINNTYQPSLIPFAFFAKYNPILFHKDFSGDNPNSFTENGFTGFRFGSKYYFGNVSKMDDLVNLLTPQTLYLAVQGIEVPGDWNWEKDPPGWARVLKTIYDPQGFPLFYLVTGKNAQDK